MPGSRWPAQNKLSTQNGHFLQTFCLLVLCLGLFFFNLYWPFVCILQFLILYFYGLCVCSSCVFSLFCFKCFGLLYLPACFLKREGVELAERRGGEDGEGNGREETMI